MKKITLIIVVLVMLLSLAGCVESYPQTSGVTQATTNRVNLGNGISRFVDNEAGVVCWLASYGISCLPIADTLLHLK